MILYMYMYVYEGLNDFWFTMDITYSLPLIYYKILSVAYFIIYQRILKVDAF